MTRSPRANSFLGKAVMKAILSERFAVYAYECIAAISTDDKHVARALDDAKEEARHARALEKAARHDRIPLFDSDVPDAQMSELRAAFTRLFDAGDRIACIYAQDILLEQVAIHLYEALLVGARNGSAPVLASLVEQILVDERSHVASAVEEIRSEVGFVERSRGLAVATATLMPVIAKYGAKKPGAPCASVCSTCRGRCCKLDAKAVDLPLKGGTLRLVRAVKSTLSQIEAA